MASVNLGRVRGSLWYFGDGMTGTSQDPSVFPQSGVETAYKNDMYLSDAGRVYQCMEAGDPETAKWVFACDISGPAPELYHGLDSSSKTMALSAYAGKLLYDKMKSSGLYAKEIAIECEEKIYMVKLTCENRDTEIVFTEEDGDTGTYEFTADSSAETVEIAVSVSQTIGLPAGSVLTNIKSSNAYILECVLYGSNENPVYTIRPSLWDAILEVQKEISNIFSITEETEDGGMKEYKASQIRKLIGGAQTDVFPVSHAKAVWWNKQEEVSVYDKISGDCLQKSDEITEGNIDAIISGVYDESADKGAEDSSESEGEFDEITNAEINEIVENAF